MKTFLQYLKESQEEIEEAEKNSNIGFLAGKALRFLRTGFYPKWLKDNDELSQVIRGENIEEFLKDKLDFNDDVATDVLGWLEQNGYFKVNHKVMPKTMQVYKPTKKFLDLQVR